MATNKEFVFRLAQESGLTREDAQFYVDVVTKLILDYMAEGEPVSISGLGRFGVSFDGQAWRLQFGYHADAVEEITRALTAHAGWNLELFAQKAPSGGFMGQPD